jgi:DNA invertase Pin-like site-specific DNA recombinase
MDLYDGYIRVSRVGEREGDSFQSPGEQRQKIEQWAAMRGVEIAAWHEDLDESGGRVERPGLEALLARIESKATGGVAVARLDRLSRLGVADALKLVERIRAEGGQLAAIDLGLDPAADSPMADFGMTIMLALAAMERERMKAGWDSARANAVARGVFVGPTPLGYEKGPESKLVPGPDAADVRQLFAVAGEYGLEMAREYARSVWPKRYWTTSAVRRLLAYRVYRGDIVSGDYVAREICEPLVDENTWYLAQHEAHPHTKAEEYPLSGIARCAACGGSMVGHKAGSPGRKQRGYRCNGKDCTERVHVYAAPVEEIVNARLTASAWKFLGDIDPAELAKLEGAQAAAQAELERFVKDTAAHELVGDELWRAGLTARQEAFAAAQSALVDARERSRNSPDFNYLGADDYRRMIASLTVARGWPKVPLEDRVKMTLAA